MMTDEVIDHVTSAARSQLLRRRSDPVKPRPYALDTFAIRSPCVPFKIEGKSRLAG
jgi:hypothetical protein